MADRGQRAVGEAKRGERRAVAPGLALFRSSTIAALLKPDVRSSAWVGCISAGVSPPAGIRSPAEQKQQRPLSWRLGRTLERTYAMTATPLADPSAGGAERSGSARR
ncbi:hypothetical protein G9272_02745 [Streptomyces asoensis]|uniref:Uncharacterized protein n=1 Tax=Streptomyces asoensis TaxID=249586 RepID=A0A6M4WFK4_9ACTN|nr:hypothetical protein [Streptomyces asoensis]QJS99359.1 hypothetical protein G9272_02745 [Streptomyces asoensis]